MNRHLTVVEYDKPESLAAKAVRLHREGAATAKAAVNGAVSHMDVLHAELAELAENEAIHVGVRAYCEQACGALEGFALGISRLTA